MNVELPISNPIYNSEDVLKAHLRRNNMFFVASRRNTQNQSKLFYALLKFSTIVI